MSYLAGKLSEIGLESILDTLQCSSMSGKLKLFKKSSSATILVKNGEVVFAKMGDILGDNALIAIIYSNFETFSFNIEDVSNELTNIEFNQKDLLMIGFLVIDEITHIVREYGNYLAMRPGFKTVTGIQRKVVKMINGGVSFLSLVEYFLGDIASVVGFIKYLINENYLIWSNTPIERKGNKSDEMKSNVMSDDSENILSRGGFDG